MMSDFAQTCEEAARSGGAVLEEMAGKIHAREKGPADLVTEADLASQAAIQNIVQGAFPDHGFLGEEDAAQVGTESHESNQSAFQWIVDPLDGTTNYVHGLENYCVSVALRHNDAVIVGTVYDPVRDHCYTAVRGEGATLNGRPLRVSQVDSLGEALIATSFAARVSAESEEIVRFQNVLLECQALRRLGSAALNLCYLAAGKLDAYWATSVKIWDVAAGMLIVEEAGGVISDITGGPFDLNSPRFAAASQANLHKQLLARLQL